MSNKNPNAEGGVDESSDTSSVTPVDFGRVLEEELKRQNYGPFTDLNPSVFHASTAGCSPRQQYIKKLGLGAMSTDDLGACRVGSLIHEFIEDAVINDSETDLLTEQNITMDAGDITYRGRYDAYDPDQGVVYDFKTRNGWYKFDPPSQRHIDQLLIYMHAIDASYGQVVYVAKGDLEVRPWPEDGPFSRDDYDGRWLEIVERSRRVRDAILDHGVALRAEDIPFEKSGDWLSQREHLVEWMEVPE